ncbi:MAG: YqjF family protein [Acidobacteriota bacterium]
MREFLIRTSHKPRPLPPGRWVMTQRWNDLLFAHWPMAPAALAHFVPDGLQIDTFEGSAWLGVVPFWMDRIKFRGFPAIPGTSSFPELNLRTYVRDPKTGTPGVLFLSLDAANLPAVLFARALYRLPYYWAEMHIQEQSEREFTYYSRRRFSRDEVMFVARYRGLGPTRKMAECGPGSLEYFLTERYCLFTRGRNGEPMRANIHHIPWPLEAAEADIERNDLAAEMGITLPRRAPVLHYSRRLAVYVWQLERLRPAHGAQRVPAATVPST